MQEWTIYKILFLIPLELQKIIPIKFNISFIGPISCCLFQAMLSPLQTFHLDSITIKWFWRGEKEAWGGGSSILPDQATAPENPT